jgi:hypothetical protein
MGVYEARDVLKLIISTDSSGATLLKQDALILGRMIRRMAWRHPADVPPGTLRLLQRIATRASGTDHRPIG